MPTVLKSLMRLPLALRVALPLVAAAGVASLYVSVPAGGNRQADMACKAAGMWARPWRALRSGRSRPSRR